jgi:hypothetical protein
MPDDDIIYGVPEVQPDFEMFFAPPVDPKPLKATVAPEAPTEGSKTPEFDSRVKLPLEGMLFLGMLQMTFKWSGHTIKIQTFDQDTYLEIGILISKYDGTWAAERAQVAALVAACLVSIDHKRLPVPLFEDETQLEANFKWVLKLHPFAINYLYEKFDELEVKVADILAEMGKASGVKSPPGSEPSFDLLMPEVSSVED